MQTPPATPPRRRPDLLAGLLVVCATILAYLPALRGAFVWNDSDYVTAPALQPFSGLGRIWGTLGSTEQYYPLLHSAFWLQHRLWGDHALGYHLVTLLAHAGCAVLFGLCLRRLAVPGAWIAAALFAVHPVHVESVAWIAEQKNTLSLLFYLAAALAYLGFDSSRRPRTYALALGLFVLSMLCKTSTVTLPAALLVVLWWKRGALEWRRDWRPLLPWLAVGAAAGLLTSWVERHYGGATGAEFTVPWLERLLVAGRAFWFYLGSLVWPFDLNFVYERWTPDAAAPGQWLLPLAGLGLLGGLWTVRRRTRAPLAALLFFGGSLFPVLGFVQLYGARYSWVWDHWQYQPDLGPIALFGAGLALGLARLGPAGKRLGQGAVAAVLVLCATLTWLHAGWFRDDPTLYRETLARNPRCWMAHANWAALLSPEPARRTEAIAHFEAALRLKPDSADIHNSLGALLLQDPARAEDARAHFDTALRLDPRLATAHNNLGLLLSRTGDLAGAAQSFRRAIEADPSYAAAAANLGALLNALGRPGDALPILEQALAADPTLAAAELALGDALRALKRPAESERHYREALRLDPPALDIRLRLAELLLETNRLSAALSLLREAVAQDAGAAEARHLLGNALQRAGNPRESLAQFREAARLQPDNAAYAYDLGLACATGGDMSGAVEAFGRAVALAPNNFRARNNLANALLAAGRLAEAEREYEGALRLQPDNAAIRQNLAYVRELQRR